VNHEGGWHGRRFRSALKAAMREAYGISGIAARASTHGAYAEALERRRRSLGRTVELHPGQLALDTPI